MFFAILLVGLLSSLVELFGASFRGFAHFLSHRLSKSTVGARPSPGSLRLVSLSLLAIFHRFDSLFGEEAFSRLPLSPVEFLAK